ncbi:GNAT family N-acetyltransferase [Streptacidiphilus cavernicola]|uniref:GNAT family N-acetyltransferase n=1 Tax=Streptacidiphilus cavernicola TaxID=3342716 RepID=A0ABV6W276_9ACTN
MGHDGAQHGNDGNSGNDGSNGDGGNEHAGDQRQIIVRAVEEGELADWGRAVQSGFMEAKGDGSEEMRQAFFDPGRTLGAYDRGRCVGTFRSTDRELTVPGGAALVADAITNVTVAATHRRRGLLTRMMTQDLAAAAERGDSLAILVAAEYRIYGRFGFGPATAHRGYSIDKLRAGGVRVPAEADGGSFEFLTMEEWRKFGPELHDRFRRTQPGAIDRRAVNWQMRTGELQGSDRSWKEPLVVLYRDAAGRPAGFLAYTVTDEWPNMITKCTLKVRDHVAVDRAAAAAMWRYVLSVDWIDKVEISNIAPDDPLPLLLDDPRACVDGGDSSADFVWLRLLDGPKAFGARTYAGAGQVVLQVADRLGYLDGRWALTAAADGTGGLTRADDGAPADLALDVRELGTLYLGSDSAARLHAAGLLRELRPGGAARTDALLRTDFRPWCPDGF